MSQVIDQVQPPATEPPASPALANSAVANCCRAFEASWDESLAEEEEMDEDEEFDEYRAAKDAAIAFRSAMPPLSGKDNIRDFIACVAHGMLIGAIDEDKGTKLLYAAQIALTGVRKSASQSGRSTSKSK